MKREFQPAFGLANKHIQTLFPNFFRKPVKLALHDERLNTPDNDFLDINYPEDNGGAIVLVFHGLEGSIDSHYSKGMMKALYDAGFFPVFMHFRGCSGVSNKTTRRYHSAETGDPAFLLDTLLNRYPQRDFYAVGFSLGGNMLLNWLNTLGIHSLFKKAVAISVPFDLAICDKRLQQGLSKIYLRHLLGKLRHGIEIKYNAGLFPFEHTKVMQSRSFWEFDEYATAPLHGFDGADDYYAKCSSRFYMKDIQTPTLVIQSKDDPFLTSAALPGNNDISSAVKLELTSHGGHVGFVAGSLVHPEYWAEQRTVNFFSGSE